MIQLYMEGSLNVKRIDQVDNHLLLCAFAILESK